MGNVRQRKVAKIKQSAMNKMKTKEAADTERYYNKPPKRKVVKEVEEIDENGNVRRVLKEVDEEGPKRAPKSRNLQEKIITNANGNKRKVFIDDQGNVVDADDIEYEMESYIDNDGNVRQRKVAKIKQDAMKRMKDKEDEDE